MTSPPRAAEEAVPFSGCVPVDEHRLGEGEECFGIHEMVFHEVVAIYAAYDSYIVSLSM